MADERWVSKLFLGNLKSVSALHLFLFSPHPPNPSSFQAKGPAQAQAKTNINFASKVCETTQGRKCPKLKYFEYIFLFMDYFRHSTMMILLTLASYDLIILNQTLSNHFVLTSTDVNDPPSNLSLETPSMKENSAERVLISSIILTDQDGDFPTCRLLDDAGGRVRVVGTNLVAGPTMTDYESAQLSSTKDFSIKLNCSDGHGMFIAKTFTIKVMGECTGLVIMV